MMITAVLTTGAARVAHGLPESLQLLDEILKTEHLEWETILSIGDEELLCTKSGALSNHQFRVSVSPSTGFAALNYTDNDDTVMNVANSFNAQQPHPHVDLIFNGETGSVFPRSAAIPIDAARAALIEWLGTRKRPTCVDWRPFDIY